MGDIVDVKLVNRTNDIVFEQRHSKSEIIDRKEGLSLYEQSFRHVQKMQTVTRLTINWHASV
jgi:hypothetical protein